MRDFLDFEKPLKELEERIEKCRKSGSEKKGMPRLIRMLQSSTHGNRLKSRVTRNGPQPLNILRLFSKILLNFMEIEISGMIKPLLVDLPHLKIAQFV